MSARPTARELHQAAQWERAWVRKLEAHEKHVREMERARERRRISVLVQEPAVCDVTGFCDGGIL